MLQLDYCVIGGGIVGLAVGAALSPFGSVAVLELGPRLIQETSSRNSGVVHSGLYYPGDSLKTRLCTAGNANIWRLQHRFPQRIRAHRMGKWIGACDTEEEAQLEGLTSKMKERGIPFEMVSAAAAHAEEPLVQMRTIVNSTSTGIVDVHSLADFFHDVVEGGPEGYVLCNAEVTRVDVPMEVAAEGTRAAPILVTVGNTNATSGAEPYTIDVRKGVVCAAGLHANTLWSRFRCVDGTPVHPPHAHRLYACKGRYAGYRGKPPLSRLVYPCPLPNLVGLGVHSVVDMAGHVRFGPDAVYVEDFADVTVARGAADEAAFLDSQYAAVRRYVPSVERERFFADFAGLRSKLAAPGEGFRDFLVDSLHGISLTSCDGAGQRAAVPCMRAIDAGEPHAGEAAAVVWLNGIESPGLTASSAIADLVATWLVGSERLRLHPPPWSAAHA